MTKMNDKELQALGTLDKWSRENGDSVQPLNEDDWLVSQHLDAYLFTPSGGRRSNVLYLVRGERVVWFSLVQESLEEAYKRVCS